ncbi:MAG: ABC transporter permease [Gammaproteobacteria bacterium]|nr:ABC transporter permease [Gammaproteobacteria bacterium]
MGAFLLRLVLRNCLRHPLRTFLTVLGIVVAITAFGLLRTTIDAWYAGANASSASRLIVRNKNSLNFTLPLYYRDRIAQIDGVKSVSYADWFGGIYIVPKNFFPRFAVEPRSYFELYPEFVLPLDQMKAFLLDRRGAVIGRKTAEKYGFKIGDQIPLIGDIFPGNWTFVVRGIYHGIDSKTDESQMFTQWDNLNETMKKLMPDHANEVGIFLIGLERPEDAAQIAQQVDKFFANSRAETLTETEKAFQLSFVAMTEAILLVIQVVSFLIIVIIMAVMANTMAMTARERRGEYATLKAIGFNDWHVVALIAGESLLISLSAGAAGIWLIYPVAEWVGHRFGSIFPIFLVSSATPWMAAAMALLIGVVAAIAPSWRASTLKVAEGFRGIG